MDFLSQTVVIVGVVTCLCFSPLLTDCLLLPKSGSPAMNTDRLQADKTLAERDLSTSMEMKSVVLSLVSQSAEDPHQPVAEDLPELTKRYLSLQDRLTEARASANHWSRKKVRKLMQLVP